MWVIITSLPDGIRSALQATAPSEPDAEAARFVQGVFKIDGAQMPLMSPAAQAGLPTPFDDPRPGETVVLLSTAGIKQGYAVEADLKPREITAAQFIAAAECNPTEPSKPLPAKTNERVMAAFETFKEEFRKRIGRARRPVADTRLRRYLSKELNIQLARYKDDPTEVRRINVLRQIFLDILPARVEAALREIRDFQIEGDSLIRRLEALRESHRLNPPMKLTPRARNPK